MPCLCEGVAGLRPAMPSHKHGQYCFGFGGCLAHSPSRSTGAQKKKEKKKKKKSSTKNRCQNRPFFRGGEFRSKSRQNPNIFVTRDPMKRTRYQRKERKVEKTEGRSRNDRKILMLEVQHARYVCRVWPRSCEADEYVEHVTDASD